MTGSKWPTRSKAFTVGWCAANGAWPARARAWRAGKDDTVETMRKIEVLRELQAVDTARDQAQTRLAQIRPQRGRREQLGAALGVEQEAAAKLRHWETEQQDLELEIGKMRTKLKADTDKLYSGRGSPRELQDLSHEVDQDTRLVSDREDHLLAVFDEV